MVNLVNQENSLKENNLKISVYTVIKNHNYDNWSKGTLSVPDDLNINVWKLTSQVYRQIIFCFDSTYILLICMVLKFIRQVFYPIIIKGYRWLNLQSEDWIFPSIYSYSKHTFYVPYLEINEACYVRCDIIYTSIYILTSYMFLFH